MELLLCERGCAKLSTDLEKYVIVAENLVKIYKTEDAEVLALQGLDLAIERGEVMAIIGNSGSGKSTLLNMIGGLDRPSAGKLFVDGKNLFKLKEKELVDYKTSTVGFVWQNNARNLIPYITAMENVMMPMELNKGKQIKNKRGRALELLELMGLGERYKNHLSQLSGGEQKRLAIALALANSPTVLLADEPTGNLDTNTTKTILQVFRDINKELGTTVVIVTHDHEVSKNVERVVMIRDGKTSSELVAARSYAQELEGVEGFVAPAQVELAVLDKAGRLQIPPQILDKLQLDNNRLHVQLDEDNRIVLSSPDV